MNTTLDRPAGGYVPTFRSNVPPMPWHVPAVLFASVSVVVGVLWDISWHSSIGRDTLWSPPHLAMYLGGVIAGVACGWYVLHTTFAGLPEDRAASVTFWRYFRGPLGAWMCIWGAFAMLTSAPFDDWWHNAYGLDVKILSPPHALLALGILSIQVGALFMVLSLQNRAADGEWMAIPRRARTYERMFSVAMGLVLLNFGITTSEYTFRVLQHSTLFYQIVTPLFVLPLVIAGVAGRNRWSATGAALTYTAVILSMHFVLPLFAAEPRLAPVRFPLEQMIPPQFPLLLVVPAVGIDLLLGRMRGGSLWLKSIALSAVFLVTFFAVQWPFAAFLQSDLARNVIFKQHLRPYSVSDDSYSVLGLFWEPAAGMDLLAGLAIALGFGVIASRLALASARWMTGVRR
ncbi:MAG: hypothetical protein GEU90_04930 [Gemmatimonas sp.]|nr:hypothetical protein [Gemmatimonas sp.]